MTSMLNKWNYDPEGEVCYGEEIVYQKARDFLGNSVEDWGCGTGWARHYFTDYRGIDGSPSGYTAELTDLTDYTSDVDNILLRQVLEHNFEWDKILANAKASFKKKTCITIHTPLVDKTQTLDIEDNGVPTIAFRLDDILDLLKDYKVTQETVPTNFEYGTELLLYVER